MMHAHAVGDEPFVLVLWRATLNADRRPPAHMIKKIVAVIYLRQTQEGQKSKTEMVYAYLTGPQFRHRIDAIVEKFTDMRDDLDRERKTMTKLWARREQQLNGVLDSTAGLYGDLQGIAGRAMQEIEGLDVLMIEASRERAAE